MFCLHMVIWFQVFLFDINNLQAAQFDTTTSGQSGPGSKSNEEILSRSPELEPYHQMQISVIHNTHPLQGIQSAYSLNPTQQSWGIF